MILFCLLVFLSFMSAVSTPFLYLVCCRLRSNGYKYLLKTKVMSAHFCQTFFVSESVINFSIIHFQLSNSHLVLDAKKPIIIFYCSIERYDEIIWWWILRRQHSIEHIWCCCIRCHNMQSAMNFPLRLLKYKFYNSLCMAAIAQMYRHIFISWVGATIFFETISFIKYWAECSFPDPFEIILGKTQWNE